MANKKVTQLTEETTVVYSDVAYFVDDPAGTPASKKCTVQNFVKGGASQGAVSALIDANLTASKNLVSDGSGKITTTNDVWCRWRGSATSAPATPAEGDIWNDTTSGNVVKIYANAGWRTLN